MEKKNNYYAVDFDGTICENEFPKIGKPKEETIDYIKQIKKDPENRVIIWTCRDGESLKEMKTWLDGYNIPYDYINENPEFDTGSPKIYADYYIDDKAVNVKNLDKIACYKDEIEKIANKKQQREQQQQEQAKRNRKKLLGGTLALGGATVAKKQYDKGNLTGRETLWHNTNKKNVGSILEKGLQASYALDPDNLTNTVLHDVPKSELANKVYLARKKINALGTGIAASLNEQPGFLKDQFKALTDTFKKRETLKAKVPTWKFKEVENPELRGAKSPREFAKKVREANPMAFMTPEFELQSAFKSLGPKGTATIEGSIPPEYLKKSKLYKRIGMDELKAFIKANPKRFAKGAGIASLGAGAAIGGLDLINKGFKKESDYKQSLLEKIAVNEVVLDSRQDMTYVTGPDEIKYSLDPKTKPDAKAKYKTMNKVAHYKGEIEKIAAAAFSNAQVAGIGLIGALGGGILGGFSADRNVKSQLKNNKNRYNRTKSPVIKEYLLKQRNQLEEAHKEMVVAGVTSGGVMGGMIGLNFGLHKQQRARTEQGWENFRRSRSENYYNRYRSYAGGNRAYDRLGNDFKESFKKYNVNLDNIKTKSEFKGIHRDLVKKYHPDVNKSPDATEHMQNINRAVDKAKNSSWYEKLARYYTEQIEKIAAMQKKKTM